MSNVDNKNMDKKEFSEEEIKKIKNRERQKKYQERQKELRKNPEENKDAVEKYEKIKNHNKEKFKGYYEQNKEIINEKNLDKYHENKEKEGVKTKRTMEIPKTKDDKIGIILQLLSETEMTNDDVKKIKDKLNTQKLSITLTKIQ
jgi:hypothetical protein